MRYKVDNSKSKALFTHTAKRTQSINFRRQPMRGGFRI